VRRAPGVLARRYARALYDVAAAQGDAVAQRMKGELVALDTLLAGNPQLVEAMASPAVPTEARGRALRAVVERAGGSNLLVRLVVLLASRERVALLGAIGEAYAERLNDAVGVLSARAVSAVPLGSSQRDGLASALGTMLGKRIELTSQVDPAVLGGVLVRVAGRSYDGTVRTRLRALRRRLGSGR
jgi:F-type H+-transporting ATPase subunit delta